MKKLLLALLVCVSISGYSQHRVYPTFKSDYKEICGFKLGHKGDIKRICSARYNFAGKVVSCSPFTLNDGIIYSIRINSPITEDLEAKKEMEHFKRYFEDNFDIKLKKINKNYKKIARKLRNNPERLKRLKQEEKDHKVKYRFEGENDKISISISYAAWKRYDPKTKEFTRKSTPTVLISVVEKQLSIVNSYERWKTDPDYLNRVDGEVKPNPHFINKFVGKKGSN